MHKNKNLILRKLVKLESKLKTLTLVKCSNLGQNTFASTVNWLTLKSLHFQHS